MIPDQVMSQSNQWINYYACFLLSLVSRNKVQGPRYKSASFSNHGQEVDVCDVYIGYQMPARVCDRSRDNCGLGLVRFDVMFGLRFGVLGSVQ